MLLVKSTMFTRTGVYDLRYGSLGGQQSQAPLSERPSTKSASRLSGMNACQLLRGCPGTGTAEGEGAQ